MGEEKEEKRERVVLKKMKVNMEHEVDMTPEQEAFCEGVSCKIQEKLTQSGFVDTIVNRVKDELVKEFDDVREVAKIQRQHPSFEDMKGQIEFEKEMKKEVKEEE